MRHLCDSRAEHLSVEILYGLHLPTVILTIISYSITHSLFHSWLIKPSFSANPSHRSPSFFFFGIHYMDSPDFTVTSEHICFLLLVFLFLHFLVVGSVR